MIPPRREHKTSLPGRAKLVVALALALGGGQPFAVASERPATMAAVDLGMGQRARSAVLRRQYVSNNGPLPVAPDRPAGVVVVANCDDGGPGSLRDAFADAVSGDVIDLTALDCSTITLTSGSLVSGVDYLTVNGPGADRLVIDAGGRSRAIALMGYYGELTLDALTIRNGSYVYSGPDIYGGLAPGACVLASQYVTISNSVLEACSASGKSVRGAAVNAVGALTLVNSIVTGATATAVASDISATIAGGVISGGAVYLTDTTISGAEVSATTTTAYAGIFGGGVFGMYGVVMTGSTITGVTARVSAARDAYAKGGGIGSPTTVIMERSTVSNNSVQGTPGYGAGAEGVYLSAIGGGGVYLMSIPRSSPVPSTITDSTISDNTALCDGEVGEYTFGGGGGIGTWAPVPVTITNSTISGNRTNLNGGGLYTRNVGAFAIANTTITDNRSDHGAGIADAATGFPYALVIDSSIVAGNHPLAGAGTVQVDTVHAISGSHNLITDANVALPVGTLMNDPMLAPLADNGGVTLTHALLSASPAIDAGDSAASLENDQRGPGYARRFGTGIDIGAFEAQPRPDAVFADGFD